MVDVNPMGMLYATRAALPGMIRRGNRHVMNVSSTSGRAHQPLSPVYAATKHGLGTFMQVLHKEVHPDRIRVTLFEPGPTKSEIGSRADSEVMRGMADDFSAVEFLKAGDVAQGILRTLAQTDRINVNEVLFRPTDQRDWQNPRRTSSVVLRVPRVGVSFRQAVAEACRFLLRSGA